MAYIFGFICKRDIFSHLILSLSSAFTQKTFLVTGYCALYTIISIYPFSPREKKKKKGIIILITLRVSPLITFSICS